MWVRSRPFRKPAIFSSGRAEAPGGLAELDQNGGFVRSVSAGDPSAPHQESVRPYSLAIVPKLDRVVVGLTAMGIPQWRTPVGEMLSHEHAGDQVQVWRLSDLKLLKTIQLPEAPDGKSNLSPNEPRVLSDGKTVLLGTSRCGLYRLTGLDEAFRDEGSDRPGLTFDRASWPHGATGDAAPHGSVFGW